VVSFVHRIAFDPEYGRFSAGLINTLDAIEAARLIGRPPRAAVSSLRARRKREGTGRLGRVAGDSPHPQAAEALACLRPFYFATLAPARKLFRRQAVVRSRPPRR
jgi:hypothetical protein